MCQLWMERSFREVHFRFACKAMPMDAAISCSFANRFRILVITSRTDPRPAAIL